MFITLGFQIFPIVLSVQGGPEEVRGKGFCQLCVFDTQGYVVSSLCTTLDFFDEPYRMKDKCAAQRLYAFWQ